MTFDRLAEDYAIQINEAEKLIKEYEESNLSDELKILKLEDLIYSTEMLGDSIEILKKLIKYKKQ